MPVPAPRPGAFLAYTSTGKVLGYTNTGTVRFLRRNVPWRRTGKWFVMSEFKFSCPNCQQVIAATSEYSGQEIACPACQTPLIVPADPAAPAPPAPKLHMAASTSPHAPAPFVPQGPPVRKKKDRTNLYTGLAVTACVIVAAIIFGPTLYAKFTHHEEVVAAQQAATNAPPPAPPPALTMDEIFQHIADAYRALSSYSVTGESVAALDYSGLNPTVKGVQQSKAEVAMEMARPDLYRVEWHRDFNGRPYIGATWCAGKGDYVAYGPNAAAKTRSRDAALTTAMAASGTVSEFIPEIFFNDTNSLARQSGSFAQTNGTALNGQDCYILLGEFKAHDVILWVNKKTFLVPQIQFIYGGKLEDADLKGLPIAEKTLLTTWAKIKGTVTDTYKDAVTNKTLAAADFNAPMLTASGQPEPSSAARMSGGPRARHSSPTSALDLTRRVREANAAEQRAISHGP